MTHKKTLAFAIALCATSAVASSALAACPNQIAVFLFDESNSMNDLGVSSTVPAEKKTAIAVNLAKNYLAALPSGTPVSVVGFGNSTQWGPDYIRVIAPFSSNLKAVTNKTQIEAAFATATAQTVPGTYWTPLAGALCDSIDNLTIDAADQGAVDPMCLVPLPPENEPDTQMQLYVLTDGGENSTPDGRIAGTSLHDCFGPETASGTSFNASVQGWGLTEHSWQWHVANKALTLDANNPTLQAGMFQIIANVSLLFARTNGLGGTAGLDGQGPVSSELQDTSPTVYDTFIGSFAAATRGTYFEAKFVNGVPAKLPMTGDTDPTPARSCVDRADTARVIEVMGRTVDASDPNISLEDMIKRDVNHDLTIDMRDYQLVVKYYGKCAT